MDKSKKAKKVELSIIVAMYNEEAVIPAFFERILSILTKMQVTYEIVCVDDGSTDTTHSLLYQFSLPNEQIKVISFSRNFGKEIALSAGLDFATGQAVVFIDADLQDPPELIEKFYTLWKAGYENVYGTRSFRNSDSFLKKSTANLFYTIFNKLSETPMPPNAGDFRLLGPKAIKALKRIREKRRFMKGLYTWVGFKSISVPYERQKRVAGHSKFTFWSLWNFALEGITSHSSILIRSWTYLGLISVILALVLAIHLLIDYFISKNNPNGFYLTILTILFFGSVQITSLGIIGEYIARIHEEVKGRPLYIVEQTYNLEDKEED